MPDPLVVVLLTALQPDRALCEALERTAGRPAVIVRGVAELAPAVEAGADVVICCASDAACDWHAALALAEAARPAPPTLLLAEPGQAEEAVAALKAGAADVVVTSPGFLERLPAAICHAVVRARAGAAEAPAHSRTAQLRTAYQELRKTTHLYQTIVATTGYAIIVAGPDRAIRTINPAAEAMFGYRAAELVGRNVNVIHDGQEIALRSHELDAQLAANAAAATDAGRPAALAETDWTFVRKDGSRFPGTLVLTSMADDDRHPGYLAIIRDISQRRATEEQLAQSYKFAQSVTEATPDIVFIIDLQTRSLTYINRAVYDVLGYRPEELEAWGSKVRERLMHPADSARLRPIDEARLAVMVDGEVYEREWRARTTSGEWRWIASRDVVFQRDPSGRPHLILSIASDITKRKEAEAALQQANSDLSLANQALGRAAVMKDEFLASMSHELRTPLNAILGRAETLQEQIHGPLNERQMHSARSIEASGRHLLELINDILDLSKIEAGKIELARGTTAIGPLCQSSLHMVAQAAMKKSITVSCRIEPKLTHMQADERRLKQILVNLLSNAVKFTPTGGAIGLDADRDHAAGIVRFTVWDTGIGIDPSHHDKLFKPFVQLDSSLSRQYNGTGLGLALVARMAELHGGRVTVESEPGHGSRFIVAIPQGSAPEPRQAALAAPAPESADPPARPSALAPLVLIADDNEENSAVMQEYISQHGYRVESVRDGSQAVARAITLHPMLVIMDIQMPGVDGLEAIARIRSQPALSTVPIIALTALAMPGDRERCMAAGANDYLSKPVPLRELLRTINSHRRSDEEERV